MDKLYFLGFIVKFLRQSLHQYCWKSFSIPFSVPFLRYFLLWQWLQKHLRAFSNLLLSYYLYLFFWNNKKQIYKFLSIYIATIQQQWLEDRFFRWTGWDNADELSLLLLLLLLLLLSLLSALSSQEIPHQVWYDKGTVVWRL